MKVKITLPTQIKDIPLGAYQEFAKVQKLYKDKDADEHIAMQMVSIFGGVPVEDLRKINLDKYESALMHLEELFKQTPVFRHTITLDGKKFGFIPNMDEITLGEYVDIDTYIKDTKDWHKFMAIVYRPIVEDMRDTYRIEEYKGSEMYAELMRQEASFADAYASILFFWTLARDLLSVTADYLKEESKGTTEDSGQPSGVNGDGIKVSTISQAVTLLNTTLLQDFPFIPPSLN